MKSFMRPELTVKNHKIIKVSCRTENELWYCGRKEKEQEPRATFLNEPSQIERSWPCSHPAWRGAGTPHF